ncbi:MAG: glycerophosphodiester phosphodiesterase [Deltaproteobacteria bacterium]|nr:glycerophosphodiester phosphodiesterase [Deltaproteobacteria bacterium]
MTHPYFDLPHPVILGHRGAAGSAPENTLLSFEKALELGAHIIESDVHATSEGEAVLIHDDFVDRVSEASGRVAELSVAGIQALDAAYHWSDDGGASFPLRGKGVRIPTLEEAFAALPHARFNLELKSGETRLAVRVLDLVRRFDREDITLLTSGEDSIMAALRQERARAQLRPAMGASKGEILAFVRSALDGEAPPDDCMALQIPPSFAGEPLVTPELIRHAHAHDVSVHVWTVNDPDEISRLLELGADGIVTDHPERMARLLREGA